MVESVPLKVPPHDIDAEESVLCAALIRPEIIPQIATVIEPGDFYRQANSLIFDAMIEVGGQQADLITISDYLKKCNNLEKAGGSEYLLSLSDAISTSAGWKHHAGIIKGLSVRRKIINQCAIISEGCYQDWQSNDKIISQYKENAREIDVGKSENILTNQKLAHDFVTELEERQRTGRQNIGPLTGYAEIDAKMHGLRPGAVTVIAAESQMGKTTLVLNICENISYKYPGKALFFIHENTAQFLTSKRMSRETQIPLTRLLKGAIHDEYEWEKIYEAEGKISGNQNIKLIDSPKYRCVENLISRCESYSVSSDISLIVIDYLQLMTSSHRFNTRHHEISHISREISGLAQGLKVPIMLLSQLNSKQIANRSTRKPKRADLRESGDIENDAFNIIMLYREDNGSKVEILCKKGKDTGPWEAFLTFERFTQTFLDFVE